MSTENLDFTVGTNQTTIELNTNEIAFAPTTINLDFGITTPGPANLSFEVTPASANLVVNSNDLSFNPNGFNMSMFAGGLGVPGGNSTTVQYNNGGQLGGMANVTYANGNITFSNIANVKIGGGYNGQFIKTDGTGNISFGSLNPGGSNTQLQYNNNGNFAGISNVTFDGSNLSLGNIDKIKITSGPAYGGMFLKTDGEGNVSFSAIPAGGLATQLQYSNSTGYLAGITNTTYDGTTLTLGAASDIAITGGSAGYVLNTDGYGALSWIPQAGGSGNGVPNGATYTIQYNAGNGKFHGSDNFTYTPSVGTINIQQVAEKVTIDGTGATGTQQYDLMTQSIILKTANATSAFAINFRGNSTTTLNSVMATGRTMTCTFINKNGANTYYPSGYTIDGNIVTPLWFDGSPPGAGSINSYDIFTYNITKTAANTFIIFASAARYA